MTKRVTVLYNPLAGKGHASSIAHAACQFAQKKGWQLIACLSSEYAGHIELDLARTAGQHSDLIILIGGDGTLRELVSGLINYQPQPEIAFIPMGNANVVARELCIPLKPLEALNVLNTQNTRTVDAGLVSFCQADQQEHHKIFLAMLEIGLGAKIVHLVNSLRAGKLKRLYQLWGDLVYALAGLLAFAGRPLEGVKATIDADENNLESNFSSSHLIVANMHTYAKGWSFTPDANCQDGLLDIAKSSRNNRLTGLLGFIAAANRRKQSPSMMQYSRARKISLNATNTLYMQIDGDPISFGGSATISIIPSAFTIHVP